MKLALTKQLPDQVAVALHVEIRKRGWRVLPSYRELCRDLEVSQYTLERALRTLTRDGVLEPARPRSRRVVKDAGTRLPSRRQLCCLFGDLFHNQTAETRQIIGKIRDWAVRQGWEVEFLETSAFELKNPARRLDQLLDGFPDATWLITNPAAPVVSWAEANQLDCLLLGGQAFDSCLPCVTTLRSQSLEKVIDHYAALGKHRVAFPVDKALIDPGRRLNASVARIFQERGLAFAPSFNLPRVDTSHPDRFRADLEKLFLVTPPQVLILDSLRHLVMAQAICLNRSLKIPDQVSLVYLGDEPLLDWMSPVPPHLEFPIARFVRVLKRWLLLPPAQRPQGMQALETRFLAAQAANRH